MRSKVSQRLGESAFREVAGVRLLAVLCHSAGRHCQQLHIQAFIELRSYLCKLLRFWEGLVDFGSEVLLCFEDGAVRHSGRLVTACEKSGLMRWREDEGDKA